MPRSRIAQDSIGVTLFYVLISLGISTFSLLRHYLSWWVAIIVSAVFIACMILLLRFLGHSGKLIRIAQWIIGGK
jgi:quinol-cytochrome oxidoreductase complex cytochrome b subunit